MIHKLLSSWGTKNIPTRSKNSGITILGWEYQEHTHSLTHTQTADVELTMLLSETLIK